MSDMNKINDDELDQASGGYIFNAAGFEGAADTTWEVINNYTGMPMGSFSQRQDAINYALSFKSSDPRDVQEINQAQVLALRAGLPIQ